MKPIHVAATMVRLFAICIFVYMLSLFVSTANLIVNNEVHSLNFVIIGVHCVLLAISFFLWNFPVSISRKLTGIPNQLDDEPLEFNQGEFLSICIFSLGLYFLYDLVGAWVYWFDFLTDPLVKEMQRELPMDQVASLWALIFKSVFVFLLLIGNRLIVKAYKTLRYGG